MWTPNVLSVCKDQSAIENVYGNGGGEGDEHEAALVKRVNALVCISYTAMQLCVYFTSYQVINPLPW